MIDFLGYRYGLQFGLIDAHADLVEVQDFLNLFQYLFLYFQLALCESLVNGALPNDLAQCGLGHVFDGFSLVVDLEQIVLQIADAILNDQFYIDDILVAGQHRGFG